MEPQSFPDDYVYLDWAATAPLNPVALEAMAPYLQANQGSLPLSMNANSLHTPGRRAFAALEKARKSLGESLGARRPSEIIFTSGATEADNAALRGLALGAKAKRFNGKYPDHPLRIITTSLEHPAVLAPAKALEAEGFEVVYLAPNRQGFISVDDLASALSPTTVLVSIQMANSEMGAVQPIACLAEAAHKAGALFHSDATQALGKIAVDVQALGVDAASFSAHKIGGPKGIGALYLKSRTPFVPTMLGGGQEDGRRSTTQNVCGAAAFAAVAAAVVAALPETQAYELALRDSLYETLSAMTEIVLTVHPQPGSLDYLPNIVSFMVPSMESQTLILRLDAAGFAVSGGSACSSHSLDPSSVLKALGYRDDEAYGELRVSFGPTTTKASLQSFVQALTNCLGA